MIKFLFDYMQKSRKSVRRLVDSAIIIGTALFVQIIHWLDTGEGGLHIDSLVKVALVYGSVILCRFIFGIYVSLWRYANIYSYLKLIFADMLAGFVFFSFGMFKPEWSLGISYTMVMFLAIMLVSLMSRFFYQILRSNSLRYGEEEKSKVESGSKKELNKINVAIVGAGELGVSLAEDFRHNPESQYRPYCFIDNKYSHGDNINGIRILQENENIVEQINNLPIQTIIIALSFNDIEKRNKLFSLYQQTGCQVLLYDYPLREVSGARMEEGKREIREFSIEDLLFRDPLSVSSENAKAYYHDKVVLISGGGGSIGSELCRQIASLGPKKLVILDIYENNAYDIQQELVRNYGKSLNLEAVIASVRDAKRLDEIFKEVRPNIVFHAAAHKHVPLMEHSGCEAIKNNVMGTYNMANMAEKYGVEKFLLVSTDKAVNPTNIMGASKRLCEMVIQCRADSKTEFTAVRFGNVLGSNGSVIPLFKRQIEAGGPITITDKRIIRYFMTIPEAVGLVMEAGAMAHNGELFVLDMGKPVKILELAENMVRFSGLRPYEDIDIIEIGLRPGEKLYEELLMKTEELDKTPNDMIFIERTNPYTRAEVEEKLRILNEAIRVDEARGEDGSVCVNGYHDAVIQAIRDTVPTYHDPEELNKAVAG